MSRSSAAARSARPMMAEKIADRIRGRASLAPAAAAYYRAISAA